MLDPHYRTLDGFAYLVAREWATFGHMFGRRCGTGSEEHDRADSSDAQRAPIFLQFLDAVWQLCRQFPREFEFNERALSALAHHAYAGFYGTLALDCEAARSKADFFSSAPSLWDYMLSAPARERFINANYSPTQLEPPKAGMPLLPIRAAAALPSTDIASLAVWPYWYALWT